MSEVKKEDEIGDGFYAEGWVSTAGEEVVDWKGRFWWPARRYSRQQEERDKKLHLIGR